MRQEVNLYQTGLRPRKSPLSGARMLLVLLATLCILAGISLYSQQRNAELSRDLERAQATRDPLQKEVSELRKKVAQQSSQDLRRQIRDLEAERQARRKLVDILSRTGTSRQKDFAPFLEAMARQHLPKLWLTGFSIDLEGAPTLRISGKTTASEQIPGYLLRLSREEVFSGLTFRTLRAERLEDRSDIVEFTLASKPE
ncbi:MAG: PilN domain-containing protein [Desulfohalobiaceae bacterium]